MVLNSERAQSPVSVRVPVPREHLSSYNAVIMGLYSLDLLSWSTNGLGAGDRKQKEKK